MKHTKRIMLAVLIFCMQQISAGEQSQEAFETERQAIIDSNIIKYSYLSDAFNFLQSQNHVDESFYVFLNNRLPHDKDEELEFGVVIDQAEGVLTANMRDIFIQTLENAITDHKKLNEFDSPIFAYVMQHKDDFMHDMVKLWLFEWSKIKDTRGENPLYRATFNNCSEIVDILISAGADINIKNKHGWTPLHMVSNPKIAYILIDAGANLHLKDIYDWTPLFSATIFKRSKIVLILINAGADVNLQCSYKQIPLHVAVLMNNLEIARILLDEGSDLNLQDIYGKTSQQYAFTLEMRALLSPNRINHQGIHNQPAACCTIS